MLILDNSEVIKKPEELATAVEKFKEKDFVYVIFTFTKEPINDSSPGKLTNLFCLDLPINFVLSFLLNP